MKKTFITILWLSFLCGYSYAQLGNNGPYSKNITVKNNDVVQEGAGNILNFGDGINVDYNEPDYSIYVDSVYLDDDYLRVDGTNYMEADLQVGTGTFDNPSANEDAYITGNIENDGTIYTEGMYRLFRRPDSVSLGTDPTIGHWKMNDNTASTVLTDSSGNDRHMTLTANSNTLSTAGKINEAIDFGGTQRAYIADDDVFSFGDGTTDSPFEVCAWSDFDASSSHQVIASKYTSGASNREWWFEFQDNNKLMLWFWDESVNGYIYALSSVLTAGEYWVCGSYDGSSSHTGIDLYVNDVLDNDTQSFGGGTYVAMENLGLTFTIGATDNGAFDHKSWNDDVRLFNRQLTAGERTNLYDSGVGHENSFAISGANAIGTSAAVSSPNNLNSEDDLIIEGSLEILGTTHVEGALTLKTIVITNTDSPYTAGDEFRILADASSGEITINLPAVAGVDNIGYEIWKTDNSRNIVTIDANASETINGFTTVGISLQYTHLGLSTEGTEWFY